MNKYLLLSLLVMTLFSSCKQNQTDHKEESSSKPTAFVWGGANVYFLLTDRFYNADTTNDVNFDRTRETGVLRGFEGGDIKGINAKIDAGYFDDLGINVIWFTPVVEQIHGAVDEGTGATYGYHGYWAKDWTALDPNFGTMADLENLVKNAHSHGIRIMMDVVMNHTGPVTPKDPFWGDEWAIQSPTCTFADYDSTVNCTLVDNLPDIKTASEEEVELPSFLVEKWKKEKRYDQEMAQLDDFFSKSKMAKTPRNYIIKWLTDYIRELGIDAFRVDTVKHADEDAWTALREQADIAFNDWKIANPDQKLDDNSFYMLGEVYNYYINSGRTFNFGDKKVDYFAHGFDNLINFQFKQDAKGSYEAMFKQYDSILHKQLKGKSVLNYATSHDDGDPFDKNRKKPFETGTKLLLTPGLSQIYYGDEIARNLTIPNTEGDATLRSFMEWDIINNTTKSKILTHWQKLGKFRHDHPAVGAGKHKMLSKNPYTFSRIYSDNNLDDKVVVGLDLPLGEKVINVGSIFEDGTELKDAYSGKTVTVKDGKVILNTEFHIVLLEAL